jgi:hypothetical protein
MTFVIEDKPVINGDRALVDEAAALLRTLKVGQSFLVSLDIANKVRQRSVKLPGKFKTCAEGNAMRIGRVS